MPYWRRTEKGLEKIRSEEVDLSKPSLILLPSFVTYENHNSDATELYTGIFEKFLGGPEIYKKANIYSYSYKNSFSFPKVNQFSPVTGSKVWAALRYKYISNGQYSSEVESFAQETLLPLMGYNHGFASHDHKAACAIAEKMKNVTFVSNSYGSIFATLLDEHLHKKLQAEGFNKDDTAIILSAIVNIAGCNVARDKGRKGFCSIYFEARNDELRAVYQRAQPRSMRYAIMKGDAPPAIEEIEDGAVVSFTSPLGAPELPYKQPQPKLRHYLGRHFSGKHHVKETAVKIPGLKERVKYWDGHDFIGHIHAWPFQQGHSDLFVRALNNAMSRGTWEEPVLGPMQLLETPQINLASSPGSADITSIEYIDRIVADARNMKKAAK